MARRRRRPRRRGLFAISAFLAIGGMYWVYSIRDQPVEFVTSDTPLVNARPEDPTAGSGMPNGVSEKGSDPQQQASELAAGRDRAQKLIASGRQAALDGDLVVARSQLNEAFGLAIPIDKRIELRAELTRLADETVFSSRILQDDLLVTSYIIAPGDTLAKIAKAHDITTGLLSRINDIANPNVIRAGRRIKIINGPFRFDICKADYTLDVYLQDTFLRQYPVGLGADDSTPTGEWRATDKLVNPVYYSPRGEGTIAADDPENPLGERWISLVGTAGAAVGMQRYGIHGTIDPESIRRSTTLGCIRLFNEDVEFLYDLAVPQKTVVVVR